ncbi:MAG: GNAT family N-acetyltransferase [Pseudomonadota bacterium]
MKTRLANSADVPAIVELLNLLFEQEADFTPSREAQTNGLRLILSSLHSGKLIVAEDENGSIVGMVSLHYMPSTSMGEWVAVLEDMIVSISARRQGAGKVLIDAAKSAAEDDRCR